jgi:Sulfotransferase family
LAALHPPPQGSRVPPTWGVNVPPSSIKILYIGGTGRTGSTLIENILGQLDGVFNGGELAFLWRYGVCQGGRCSCGKRLVECQVWRAIFDDAYGGVDRVDAKAMVELRKRFNSVHLPVMLTEEVRECFMRRLGHFPETVEHLYRSIQRVTGSRVIVDSSKEPHYSYILRSRSALDLRFLHLVRDPRAIAFSWQRKREEAGFDTGVFMKRRSPLTSAVYFDVSNTAAETIWSNSPAQYMRLRYEDFIARPVETLREVGDFIEEDFDASPLFADGCVSTRPTHSAWGNPNRFRAGVVPIVPDTAWSSAMPAWRRMIVTALTYPLMHRYGYGLRVGRHAAPAVQLGK